MLPLRLCAIYRPTYSSRGRRAGAPLRNAKKDAAPHLERGRCSFEHGPAALAVQKWRSIGLKWVVKVPGGHI